MLENGLELSHAVFLHGYNICSNSFRRLDDPAKSSGFLFPFPTDFASSEKT